MRSCPVCHVLLPIFYNLVSLGYILSGLYPCVPAFPKGGAVSLTRLWSFFAGWSGLYITHFLRDTIQVTGRVYNFHDFEKRITATNIVWLRSMRSLRKQSSSKSSYGKSTTDPSDLRELASKKICCARTPYLSISPPLPLLCANDVSLKVGPNAAGGIITVHISRIFCDPLQDRAHSK